MYRQYKEQLKLSSYKLVSYNALGPGELPRLIFAQAGQEFTDERVNFKDWEKVKPTTPLGQLPVLVVDGETIPQTMAIVRFLATRFGLMGKSDIENAKIDAILDTCTAYLAIMTGLATEKNEAMKKIKMDKVVKEISPAVHTYFESVIKANSKSEWTIGDKLTVADLAIYDYLFRPMKKGPKILDSFPCIQRIGGKVEALPNIAKWIKNRPSSEF